MGKTTAEEHNSYLHGRDNEFEGLVAIICLVLDIVIKCRHINSFCDGKQIVKGTSQWYSDNSSWITCMARLI